MVGGFSDGDTNLILLAARPPHIAGTHSGKDLYLSMELLKELGKEKAIAYTITPPHLKMRKVLYATWSFNLPIDKPTV